MTHLPSLKKLKSESRRAGRLPLPELAEFTVAIGGKADIGRTPPACRSVAIDPSLHLAANFAVMHDAALWYQPKSGGSEFSAPA
jgi:hypothetical protein